MYIHNLLLDKLRYTYFMYVLSFVRDSNQTEKNRFLKPIQY